MKTSVTSFVSKKRGVFIATLAMRMIAKYLKTRKLVFEGCELARYEYGLHTDLYLKSKVEFLDICKN